MGHRYFEWGIRVLSYNLVSAATPKHQIVRIPTPPGVGGKLEVDHKDNPAGGPSHPPLCAAGKPGDPNWMGLSWSGFETLVPEKTRTIPAGPGLYVLTDAVSQEIIYIGQSGNCADRVLSDSKKSWDGKELRFSFYNVEKTVLPHQLKELENDLIGNYFEQYRKAPEYQFRNST